MTGGGIVMVVLMILVLPVAVMLGGAIWSALMGFLLSENACDDPEREAPEGYSPGVQRGEPNR